MVYMTNHRLKGLLGGGGCRWYIELFRVNSQSVKLTSKKEVNLMRKSTTRAKNDHISSYNSPRQ